MKAFKATVEDDHEAKLLRLEPLDVDVKKKKEEVMSYCTDTKLIWLKAIPDSGRTFLPHKAHKPSQQVQHLLPWGSTVNTSIQTLSPALGIDIC